MSSIENKTDTAAPSANVVIELQAACVGELVNGMKRMGKAENALSKAIMDLVDSGFEASITAQKDAARMATEAMSSNDPQAAMALPQQLLQRSMQQGMEHSIRNLQFVQSLFAQIYRAAAGTAEPEKPTP